jgi:four helix bundle protein
MDSTVNRDVDPLWRVQAYRLAMDAMRDAKGDAEPLRTDASMRDAAGQLLRAAGSIAANIAEGYSRGTPADRRRFYEYALGSVRETMVWYDALPHPDSASRIERLISIRRLLLTMIRTARNSTAHDNRSFER